MGQNLHRQTSSLRSRRVSCSLKNNLDTLTTKPKNVRITHILFTPRGLFSSCSISTKSKTLCSRATLTCHIIYVYSRVRRKMEGGRPRPTLDTRSIMGALLERLLQPTCSELPRKGARRSCQGLRLAVIISAGIGPLFYTIRRFERDTSI
ncbi:uncharacterized protein B0T23DRAFT_395832 [Neurospora hispaniola]|uniref:Uncharacterized protein n=1 Tax=Neurospora hispaniola TaxID=588809 RepID=A0AAJ0I7N9_9PEZI|nr:hypothetical protein B0T23DRAFT_395832 [Neurospora hispaniola]